VIRSARAGTLLALIAVVAGSGQASAATFPSAGGSTFDRDAQGWSSARATCTTVGGGGGLLCSQENVYDGSAGNPGGAILARTKVIANGGELFRADSTWRSPSFSAPANAGSSVLQYDRRLNVGGVVALSPHSSIQAVIVDETDGTAVSLGTENITDADSAFAASRVTVAPGTLAAGRKYHLELRSSTTTTTAREGILGTLDVRYDNVSLFVNDQPGAAGSSGVTFPGTPISSGAFSSLSGSLSLNAEVGHGPGGSLVPLSRCTIVGTPGNDRIRGSTRNDVICGLGGNDAINGGRGRDIIDGGNGNDRLSGSSSGDLLLGLRGRDRLDGGSGNDRIGAGAGADRAGGRAGKDRLVGASGSDRLYGDSGADLIYGRAGKDVLAGQAGNDRLNGGRDSDRISGGSGRDRIAARDHRRDRVDGGSGRDRAVVDRAVGGSRRHHYYSPADKVRRVERTG
jgi:Ca2+-binding RTX toxin-like protein